MSNVINLAGRSKQVAERKPFEGSAEIVIFPGVRFERLEGEAEAAPSRGRRIASMQNEATAKDLL